MLVRGDTAVLQRDALWKVTSVERIVTPYGERSLVNLAPEFKRFDAMVAESSELPALPATDAEALSLDHWSRIEQAMSDDELARIVDTTRDEYEAATGQSHADPVLAQLYQRRGFDALPARVVDSVDELGDEWTVVYRGLRGSDDFVAGALDDMRTGVHYAGTGIYGNGTYASTSFDEALGYGDYLERHTQRLAYSPGARYVKLEDLKELFSVLDDLTMKDRNAARRAGDAVAMKRTQALRILIQDEGKLATLLGFDGITLETVGTAPASYRVLLNRAQLAVERTAVGGTT
jgi:hypothetical protein